MECKLIYDDGQAATLAWHEANETYTFTPEGEDIPANPTIGSLPTVDHVLARLDELGIYNLSPESLADADELQRIVEDTVGPSMFSSHPTEGLVVLTPSGRVAATAEFVDGTSLGSTTIDRNELGRLLVTQASPFSATDVGCDIDEIAAEFGRTNQVDGSFSYSVTAVADWVDTYRSGQITLPVNAGPEVEPRARDHQPVRARHHQLSMEPVG